MDSEDTFANDLLRHARRARVARHRRVRFRGELYWFLADRSGRNGPLAFDRHCAPNGELVFFWERSYAHVFDGEVRRNGVPIGSIDEFEEVPRA